MKFNKCNFSACNISATKSSGDLSQRNYYIHLHFRLITISIWFIIIAFLFSCNKLVEVDSPPTSQTSENVYTNDATAASVLTGIYADLSRFNPLSAQSINSISLVSGLAADELTLHGGAANANARLVQYYKNNISPGQPISTQQTIWSNLFAKLYIVNLALERLSASSTLTPSVKQQLTGEAKFLRAFFYFYLVNLYGEVPLTVTSDYRINAELPRSSQAAVFEQIVNDLKDAQELLSEYYVASNAISITDERVRPNKWTAKSLLARVYLYTGDWAGAEAEATAVINNVSLYDTVPLNKVFFKNSKEAIWQLQPVNANWNTEDARIFILPSTGPTSNSSVSGFPVYISINWLNNFEPNDNRRTNWINSVGVNGTSYYFPYKYKSGTLNNPVTEYLMVLRLAEQWLIRAEARAQQNNISGAQSDLDIIRARAGLPGTAANDKSSLIDAILHERQVELFTEWAHRWLDLKRTGKIDAVMTITAPAKGTNWNSNWKWWPIPQYDITQNPNLVQNTGY